MAFEATKNFKKKSAGGRFEATDRFDVDSAYVSGKLSKLQNDYSKLISDYEHTNTEMSKYVMGEKSFFDKLQAPGYKAVEESPYRERALKIKKELDLNKDFMDPESYLAYNRQLNYILDDNTLKDRISGFSEVFRERNESGISREDYRKQFEKSYENQEYLESVKRKYAIDDNTNAIKIIGISEGINIPEKQTANKMSVDKEASREYNSEKGRIERTYGISLSYDDYEGNTVKLQKIMESLPAGREKQKILDFSKINPEEYDYAQSVNSPSAVKQKTNLYQTDRTGTVHDEEETDILKRDKAALRQIAAERITMDDWNAINEGNAYENIAADYKVSAIINNAKSKEDFKEKSKIGDEEKESLRFDSSPLSTSETAKKKFFGGGTLDSAFDLSASYDEITNGMSDEEKNVFNYILNTEGKTAATEYRQLLNQDSEFYEDIGSRKGREFYEKNLKGHPILTALYSVPAGFFGQFGSSIQSAGDFALGTTPDPKENTELSAIEAAKQDHGALYNVLLDLGVNIGDNAPSWIIGGAAGAASKGFGAAVKTAQGIANSASAGTMFLSAGSAAYSQAIEEGYSAKQAQNYGVITGLSEAFLEKALGGIAGMGGKITGKSVEAAIKNIEKAGLRMLAEGTIDMAGEFTEEYLQEILDPVFRNITLDENNEFKPFTADALYAGMLGALSAATVNAGPLTVDAVSYASSKAKNAIDTAAAVKKVGSQITGTDAGSAALKLAENMGIDVTKASADVKEGNGLGKLREMAQRISRNKAMGKTVQKVVQKELAEAKKVAMDVTQDEGLAEFAAAIATGTSDDIAFNILNMMDESTAEKVLGAIYKIQERTENAEVRNMINDIVETAESAEGKAYNANNIYGIKREGGTTKYILEDGTEVDSGEFGLTSKDKTLFVNAVKNMTDAEANEMISAYRKYANGTDEGVFATTWGLYRSLGETGAAKNSERVAGYKSRIYFTDDAEVNNVLVASAIEQGVKARARNEKKVNIKARAERVIKERGRAKGEVRGEEHLGKNKSGAKTVSRTLAKLGYDVEFLSEDSKIRGKRIGDTKINGAYDAETNTIYLRADAEYNASDVRGILGHTLAHEITHSIKVWSESDYNVLTDYIRDALGADFDTLVRQKMNALGMDYGMATDEVIADGCEMLLRDSKALEKLAAENANLFVKIASKIKEFITKLRKAQADMYGGNEELHDSALRLREALKSLEELQEVFDNALENSIRNMRNALAEAENAKARANLDVLEKAAEDEGLKLSEETDDKYDFTKSFAEQVNDFKNGKFPQYDTLLVGGTPQKWQSVGFNALPVTLNQTHVDYALNGTKDLDHTIGEALLKNLPEAIKDPIAIIQSQSNGHSDRAVVIFDFKHNGSHVISAIEIDGTGRTNNIVIDSNAMTTLFAKGNALSQLKNAIEHTNNGAVELFYWDKNRAVTLLQRAGLQLPSALPHDGSVNSIRDPKSNVKTKFENATETQQFKRWFGKSKAVNRDGSPKLLYHYTDNVFSIFDISRSGANQGKTHGDGIYLSSNPNEFSYAGKNRMQLYASIANPFEMQLSKAEAEKIYDKYFKPFHKDTYNTYKPHVIEKLQSPTRVFDYLNEAAEKNNIKTSDILGELGYDGVHDGSEWVAFKETQVKSATDNIGTYDGANGDIYFSQETETSRDTLVSDMEAVAETDEEKSFVEKLKAEVEKANALQEELDEVNRKIKEASFTKGADRSVLPSLNEEKSRLVKQLNRLDSKFYGYRGYDTFKTLAERKSKDAVIAERLRGKEALRSQKQKYEEAAQSIKDTLAQREENRRRREIMRDIAKRLDAIDAKAKTDSKTKHIPSALRGVVAQFRMAVNTETQDYGKKIEAANESIEKYSKRLEKLNAALEEASAEEAAEIKERIDAVNAVIEQKQRAIENYKKYAVKANDYTDALTNFYNAYYEKSLENDYEKAYYADTEAVVSAIEALKERIAGRSLYELNSEELQDVLDVTKMVQKSISNANKLFGETRSLADSVAKVADETEKYKALKKRRDKNLRPGEEKQKNKLGRWAEKNIKYNMLKPAELFLRSGSDTLYGLYKKLQRAEGDAAKLIEKYGNKYREAAKENGVTKKQFDTKHRIDLDSGITVELTSGELMTLYATSRRKQGRQHLLGGGFRLSGGIMREVRNGKTEVLKKDSLYKLTETDLEKFSNELEDNLKKFTETMQEYMSDEMAKDGNKVSMQLYDVALFNDKFYIPLDVDDSTRPTSIEKGKGNIKIINKGMTQSLNEKAANGVYISNFSDVFAKHAQDMSSYATFTIPLENLERVLNSSADGVRIKAIIGENLSREIFDFLKDVNGGIKSDGVLTSRLFSLSKAARVGLNLRVIIQQPTAIIRAMSEIDPKYFFGTSTKGMSDTMKRKLLEEMHDYTSTWIVKSMGGIDLNTSKAISDQITDLGVRGNKLRETIPNIINKGSFYLAEKADQIAWMSLYAACKREARAQGFTGEYLLKRAGERFDEIVNKTQVYDSVFSRAKILRSSNWLNKLASMFMAEPLTTANMMMDAARLSSHGNSAKAARITASVALSIVITNAFAAIVDALRDDDDDETYGEKYLEAIIRNLMNDFDPATYIPYARDVISLAQGYDIERADMSLIADFIAKGTNLIKAYKNGGDLADSWHKFAGSILDVTGIPFSSLYRDVKAIVNTVFRGQGRKVGDSTKTNVALGSLDAFAGEIPGYAVVYSPHSKSDKLYYAMVNGDDKYVKITKEEYADDEDKFNQLLKKGLKENDFRVAEAAQAHMDGDTEKYLELISEVVKDGYDEKIVQGAILSAENKLNGEDENVDRAIDGMLATKGDIISALEKGDSKYLNDYYEAKVNKYSSGEGKKDNPKKNALSATKAMLTDYYKPIYEEADSAERRRIRSILLKVKIDGKYLYDSSSFDNWDE